MSKGQHFQTHVSKRHLGKNYEKRKKKKERKKEKEKKKEKRYS